MKPEQVTIISNLKDSIKSPDFIEIAYDVVNEMQLDENPFIFVEPILKIMEDNPDAEFGQPGPLVHFIESYYKHGYEELLLKSVKGKPTFHTIWMLNRIINDPNLLDRKKYIEVMKEILKRTDVSDSLKNEIEMFLS